MALQALAQSDSSLDGSVYRGTEAGEFREGCEGCGNPGEVEFLPHGRVDCSLPGSDTPAILNYMRDGNLITIEDGDWIMELSDDTLFFTAYDYRHVYLRVTE
jgi:hypothetical protein